MKKFRFLTIIGTIASLLLTSVPCYATEYTNGATSGSIAVTAVVSSTYSITLPASLTLELSDAETSTYSNNYTVGVKANLLDNENITVTPASTFAMTAPNQNDTATASVSQPITMWRNDVTDASTQIAASYTDYVNTTGSISVVLTGAGNYSGLATFTFAKNTDS